MKDLDLKPSLLSWAQKELMTLFLFGVRENSTFIAIHSLCLCLCLS